MITLTRKVKHIKRVVVKIGTSTLTGEDGSLDEEYMQDVARQTAALIEQNKQALIVSSGAIGLGVKELRLEGMPRDIPTQQGAAAVGQSILMESWRAAFRTHGLKVAQLLLTYESFSNRRTYLNLRNSMGVLMDYNTVMIINENDPISVHEIEATFGDNDKLSALVASKVDADLLLILTDVDGMYDRHPEDPRAQLIPLVEEITPEMEAMCGDQGSWRTKGGMKTKIEAAQIAMDTGCDMIIANAREKDILLRIMTGEDLGTLFKASETAHRNKDRWIKLAKCSGTIKIDSGAAQALMKGSALLPSGVIDIQGDFEAGDVVSIVCDEVEVARGVVDYSSQELDKIGGKQTHEIEKILGFKHYDNVVRRDNMVLTQNSSEEG